MNFLSNKDELWTDSCLSSRFRTGFKLSSQAGSESASFHLSVPLAFILFLTWDTKENLLLLPRPKAEFLLLSLFPFAFVFRWSFSYLLLPQLANLILLYIVFWQCCTPICIENEMQYCSLMRKSTLHRQDLFVLGCLEAVDHRREPVCLCCGADSVLHSLVGCWNAAGGCQLTHMGFSFKMLALGANLVLGFPGSWWPCFSSYL